MNIIDEKNLLNKIVDLHNFFCNMQRLHPHEASEWAHHIHGLQDMVFYRIVAKEHPEIAFSDPHNDLLENKTKAK